MPPFHAAQASALAQQDALRLSDDNRAALLAWLRSGAPGEPGVSDVLIDPLFDERVQALIVPRSDEPVLMLKADQPFVVPAEGLSVVRTFVLPFVLGDAMDVVRAEVIVSEPSVARHAFLSVDRTGSARMMDEADPFPGYGAAADIALAYAGSFASWSLPFVGADLPRGFVRSLPREGDLLVQFDFHPVGREVPFTFEVRLFARPRSIPPPEAGVTGGAPEATDRGDREGVRPLVAVAMGSLRIDLPPGAANVVLEDEIVLPVDAALVEVLPHGGAICRSIHLSMRRPGAVRQAGEGAGEEDEVLLAIPEWDPNWHRGRTLLDPPNLPAGSVIRLRIAYDNSAANLRNPFEPPQRVELGHGLGYEPGLVLLQFAPRDPGAAPRLEVWHRSEALRRIRERTEWLRTGAR